MKNIYNFTQWKNGLADVTFMCAITHQKHLTQFGCSTWSAVDIFNTLHVFIKEQIRENKKLSWSVWGENNKPCF